MNIIISKYQRGGWYKYRSPERLAMCSMEQWHHGKSRLVLNGRILTLQNLSVSTDYDNRFYASRTTNVMLLEFSLTDHLEMMVRISI